MKYIHVSVLLGALWLSGTLAADDVAGPRPLPPASPEKLPLWRGFNLLEKFQRDWNQGPFVEEDFRLINQLGFNFVRLPMDYRIWAADGTGTRFREAPLKDIDRAVAWGGQYGIHVCLNFHRAPGYTVASPPEPKSLWTDAPTQRVCANHWALFARRYKDVPNDRLSFNLFNEPAGVEAKVYVNVVRDIVAAIRKEDPKRLVVSDGLQWGTRPIPELIPLKIAQATRGYTPMELTHYKASWVSGADRYPRPTWPILVAYGSLYGSVKRELQKPLVIDGPFPNVTRLRFRVGTVSSRCLMLVDADGKTIFKKDFVCGPGPGEWKKVEFKPQWQTYQNFYDRDYETRIPAGTRQVTLHVTEGDWMQIRRLTLKPEGATSEVSLDLLDAWGQQPAQLHYEPEARGGKLTGSERRDRAWLQQTMIRPWQAAEARGIGVMVGEFGAFNQTPHDVTLAWMEDCLQNWKKAGWGWSLWNFRGSFGILDSQRPDVVYENFHGHKLDRKMLELLQKY